jgi:hypothetical protein
MGETLEKTGLRWKDNIFTGFNQEERRIVNALSGSEQTSCKQDNEQSGVIKHWLSKRAGNHTNTGNVRTVQQRSAFAEPLLQ